jgi:branched-chain amino acid transport system substrate-binding protein
VRRGGSWRKATVVAGVVALGLPLLAACGSSSKTSSSATTTPATSGSGATTPATSAGSVASGTPITIGVAMPDRGSLSLAPPNTDGLTAGLDYVNKVLGGVHGHPIKTILCNSDETPALEVNCANNFVTKGVVAVFDSYDAGFAAESPILTRADIPIFGVEPADAHDDDLSTDYFFGPPNEAFAVGPLQVFHDAGENKVQLTIANVPSAVDYVNEAIIPVAKKLGMDVHTTYYDESSVNWQVVANSLLSNSPQVTGIIAGPEGDCTSLLKALRTDGDNGPILMGSCSAYVKADPSGAVNTYSYSAGFLPSLASAASPVVQAQIKVYDAEMAKVGHPDVDAEGQWAVNSFSALVDLHDTLEAGTAPYTDTTVRADLAKVKNYQAFMGPIDTCNHLEWPGTASCNKDLLFVKVLKGDIYQSVEPGGFAALNPKLL